MYTKEITGRHLCHLKSLIDEFEFLRSLAWRSVCLSGFGAPVENVNPLCWLFSTLRLWTRETSVTCCDSTESALTPLQFACTSLLDALNGMHRMSASLGAIALDLTGHLDHCSNLLTVWVRACDHRPVYEGVAREGICKPRDCAAKSVNVDEP
jgi:hypothetical protein